MENKDDETVVFRLTKPYGPFLWQLASGFGEFPTIYPKHYLRRFHIRYSKDNVAEVLSRLAPLQRVARP